MDKSELPGDITELKEKAEAGDAAAQVELGNKYYQGIDVEQNNNLAVEWCRKAAEQGHPRGQNAMGIMYQNGFGVEQSFSEALAWYNKAAEQGYAAAQNHIGAMYRNGHGVEQSDSEAIAWYSKAAEQDYPSAQTNLGWMYSNGYGVETNHSEALAWYTKAAAQGNAQAQNNIGVLYQNGEGVKKNSTEAVAWYRKSADQKNARAQFNLGLMYINGNGVEKNYVQAQELFRNAALSTDPDLRFDAIEKQDQAERYIICPKITDIRKKILNQLRVNTSTMSTMTHYTSLSVGSLLLLEKSPLRLGHISALNDPNEGKLLWRYLGHEPVEGKPAFVGCYLPEDDSLNMWRFYSKNHQNDDACGCAITFNTKGFFNFNLLPESSIDINNNEEDAAFSNSGKSPQESASFYRIIYTDDDMNIRGDDSPSLGKAFSELKSAVDEFLGKKPDNKKFQQLSRLLGPLPYLLKDTDYESEKEHRIIVTHLNYGSKEIQVEKPLLENGIPKTSPKLYLELHRTDHLAPVRHVTLGPKAPYQEMMAPYWHHRLASEFPNQLKTKPDFYVRTSKCAYK
ncbi:DUF2971 domain-containing protein [Aeromonas caviae]|uniref:DUF2971 domain-containing protein n=1 Tax=Aeromonas caviae TaxID=648 RepID=UPI00191D958D|nr:DUF2971 domain-containing protein [Aeromonas caviae]MBL0517693.1 SEL1-like repeat protein [Aeromonas caviae]